MLRLKTNNKGNMALKGDKGEIKGIDCRIAHARKYMLAYLLN